MATNSAGSASSSASLVLSSSANPGRLINLSASALTGPGPQLLTVGFVSGGQGTSGSQNLLIRAIGPALQGFGVSGILTDPTLTVLSGQLVVATNSGWATTSSNQAAVAAADTATFAFALANPASFDSALVASLPEGGYTAQVGSRTGGSGIALGEIYDDTLSPGPNSPRLLNVSCRQQVLSGGILTLGFTVGGSTAKTPFLC